MNIVIFSQLYFPETATINEASARLVEHGHNISIMTGLPNAPGGNIYKGYGFSKRLREVWRGVDVRRNWLVPRGSGSAIMMSLNYLSFVVSCTLGLWRLRGKKIDVVLVNQLSPVTVALPAIVYKWIVRKPMVIWIHDLWPDSVIAAGAMKEGRAYTAIGQMVKVIYRNCDLIFIQSMTMRNILEDRGVNIPVVFLPNPIDPHFVPLEKAERPEAMKAVPEGFIVMFAGSIGKAQDMPTVLSAASCLRAQKEIHFVIVGDGRDRREAEARVRSLELTNTVHFVGRHPEDTMPAFYASSDVMLVTLRDEPIFSITVPLKIQTYMASAKPIVCNVRGEAARVVNDAQAGFTAPPANPGALAEAILEAYKLRGEALSRLGCNARKYFDQHYGIGKIITTLEETLSGLVSNQSCAALSPATRTADARRESGVE